MNGKHADVAEEIRGANCGVMTRRCREIKLLSIRIGLPKCRGHVKETEGERERDCASVRLKKPILIHGPEDAHPGLYIVAD